MFKTFWLANKTKIIHELGFWLTLVLGFIASDGMHILVAIYNGDFSEAILSGLFSLIVTSIVKALLVMVFPALFPLYRKNEGILPAKKEETSQE